MDLECSRITITLLTKIAGVLLDFLMDSFNVDRQTAVVDEISWAELTFEQPNVCLVNQLSVISQYLHVIVALLANVAGGCSDLVMNLFDVTLPVVREAKLLATLVTLERLQLLVDNPGVLLETRARAQLDVTDRAACVGFEILMDVVDMAIQMTLCSEDFFAEVTRKQLLRLEGFLITLTTLVFRHHFVFNLGFFSTLDLSFHLALHFIFD